MTTKSSSYFVVMESVQKRFLATQRLVPLPGTELLLTNLSYILLSSSL